MSTINSKVKAKKQKNNFFSRFKGLPKISIIVYFLICCCISSIYFSFSYYNWRIILSYLGKIIDLDIVFADTYIYSASSIYLEDLLLREKIVKNSAYEIFNNSYQKTDERLNYFYNSLNDRMQLIGNNSAFTLMKDSFETNQSISDISVILSGNICKVLYMDVENYEDTCEELLNHAFQKGIGNVFSEFIKHVKSREETIQYLPSNPIEKLAQNEKIRKYVNSYEYFEIYLSNFYLHEILAKYFDINNLYYLEFLAEEQLSFFAFLFVSLFFVVLFTFVVIYLVRTKIRLIYNWSCFVLSFIPYERLTKDEQIFNFLKQFLRKNE